MLSAHTLTGCYVHRTLLFPRERDCGAPFPQDRHSSVCLTRVPLGMGVTLSFMEGKRPCSDSHFLDQEGGSEKPTPFTLQEKSEQRFEP